MRPPEDLSEAEKRLLAAVRDGNEVDFTVGNPERDDPARGAHWGADRTLRSKVVQVLCAEAWPDLKIDMKGVRIIGARIEGVLDLEAVTLTFPLRLRHCSFSRRPIFVGAAIKLLDLRGAYCADGIDATDISVTNDVLLDEGFTADGEVVLVGARIGADLGCRGGRFTSDGGDAVSADRITVAGGVYLREGFVAEGEVRLLRAKIGGDLDCTGARFANHGGRALNIDGAEIGGNVFLRRDFTAEGEVFLVGMKIGGGLECVNARFTNSQDAALTLEGTQIGAYLIWCNVTAYGLVNLSHASARVLMDEVESWPAAGNLLLDGFEYETLPRGAPITAKERLDWLARQRDFSPQPYEHLVRVLRRIGHEHDARVVAIAKQEVLRRKGGLPLWGRIWSRFLGVTVAHGYKPWRALWFALFVIAVGWGTLFAANRIGIMVPTEQGAYAGPPAPPGDRQPVRPDYPPLVAPLYSLDVFLPVVNLHQEDYWLPDGSKPFGLACWIYMWLHILAGWTLTTVLIAALTGLIKRD